MTEKLIQEPSIEEWRALYETALAFKRIEPWDWMFDCDIFGVKNPETDEIGYCSVFGNLRELFALNVYLGSDGLEGYIKTAREQIKEDKLVFAQRTLMASFENKQYAQKKDKETMKQLNLHFSGQNYTPLFRSYRPGFYPWFLTAEEARFLSLALEQASELSLRFKDDSDLLKPPSRGYYLVRVKSGKEGWHDEWLKPEPIAREKIKVPEIDTGKIEIIKENINKSKSQPAGIWEIDYFIYPSAIKGKNESRPFFPKGLIFAHHDSYYILHYQMFDNPEASLKEYLDGFLEFLKKGEWYPQAILVKKRDLYDGLKDICDALNIKLKQTGRLKAVISAQNGMKQFLSNGF